MQPTSHKPVGRIAACLLLLLGALLPFCGRAQTPVVPTIGPIPNQIAYVGGSQLVVPLKLGVSPAGGQFDILVSNPSRRPVGQFRVMGFGTNRFLVLPALLSTLENTPFGNTTFYVSVIAGGVTNQTSFILTVLPGEFTIPVYQTSLAIARPLLADFTGDGYLDAVGNIMATSPSGFGLQVGTLSGRVFSGITAPFGAGKASGIVPADFDGDGDLDGMLLGNGLSNSLLVNVSRVVLEGTQPLFTNSPVTVGITNVVGAAWTDVDGDGDLDLVVTGTTSDVRVAMPTRLLRNEGGGVLVKSETLLPAAAGPVIATDFDGDGADDLLLTNTGEQGDTPVLLHNNGEGGFADTGTQFPHGLVAAAGWSDFNGDGLPDVWLQFRSGSQTTVTNNELVLLQQRDDGRFMEVLRLGSEVMGSAGTPSWGDFDNDGTPDFIAPVSLPTYQMSKGNPNPVAVLGTDSILTIWHNDGAGHFQSRGFVTTNSPNLYPAAGDMDGDGALDLVLRSTVSRSIFLNPDRPANLPPSAPDGLQAFAEGRNLFFFWDEATDPNQTAPLTYNLRVGTRPGANDIVASMSLGGGTRQVVAPGNCGFNSFRALRLALPEPTLDALYWSVQAVDNSFVGSPFAPEQILALDVPGNRPPIISGLSNVVVLQNNIQVVRFTVSDDRTRLEDLTIQITASNLQLFPPGSLRLSTSRESNAKPPTQVLTLVPARNVVGESDIKVTVIDRKGLATTGTFHISVLLLKLTGSQPSLQLSAPVGDGALRFSIKDAAMPGLRLEQSEDLIHWSPVQGMPFDSNSLPGFSLPQPTDKDRLFYRLSPAQ